MANIVKLKRSSVVGKVPDAGNIEVGEPAVNLVDKILYTKDTGGNVIVIGSGTTSNVIEGSNLYFTNARVVTAISSQTLSNATFSGELVTTSIIKSLNSSGDEGGEVQLAIPVTNTSLNGPIAIDVYQNKLRIFETTGTNRGVYIDLSVANSGVGTNLISAGGGGGAVNSVNGQTGTVVLSTANIAENGNLYYTDARVYSNVRNVGYATNANVVLKANITDLTTLNVSEVTNLYFTNARVYSNVISIGYATNANMALKANITDLTTSNVSEGSNLYYTDARVYSNVISIGYATNANVALKANVSDLTTANVTEVTNLYFTNARSRQALTAGTGVTYDNSTGTISIGQNVDTHSSVTFGNVTVTGNLTVQGNAIVFESNTLVINDPLIQVGRNPVGDSVDLGFFGHYIGGTPSIERHAGLFRDASDGQFKLFANLDPEPVNVVDTSNTSYQSANLVVNFIVGKVTDISNHSTTNLSEGTNLYFTNARVYSNVVAAGFYDTVSNTAPINASESGTTLTLSHATSGVSAATYGGAATVPVYVVNDTGHITSASNVAIAIASGAVSGLAASATTDTTNATNITSGTLGAARLPNSGVLSGTYGGLDYFIPVVAVDSYGRVTSASNIIAPYSVVNASEVSGGVNLRQRIVINAAGYLAAESNIKLASGSGISITRNNDNEIFITTAGDGNFSNVSANNQFIKINNLGSVSGATTINLTLGNMITATATGAVQWTVTGLQGTSNYGSIFLLELTNGGVGTQTWMSGIKWPSGTAPTLQASGVDVLAFFTDDNGTTWRGVLNMSNSS